MKKLTLKNPGLCMLALCIPIPVLLTGIIVLIAMWPKIGSEVIRVVLMIILSAAIIFYLVRIVSVLLVLDLIRQARLDICRENGYFELPSTVADPACAADFIEQQLKKDGYSQWDIHPMGKYTPQLFVTKHSFSPVSGGVDQALLVYTVDRLDKKTCHTIADDALRRLESHFETKKTRLEQPNRGLAFCILADELDENTAGWANWAADGITTAVGNLNACFVDFAAQRVYFDGRPYKGNTSSERLAQKMLCRAVLGWTEKKLPPMEGAVLTDEQKHQLAEWDSTTLAVFLKDFQRNKNDDGQKAMEEQFSRMKDGAFDRDEDYLYYKENGALLTIPYFVEEMRPDHLLLLPFDSWEYPRTKKLPKREKQRIEEAMERYLQRERLTSSYFIEETDLK